ncbi:MAG: SDR family NAD(P)-dependent oxidoreductase, partial [Spirochaetota bacterium]
MSKRSESGRPGSLHGRTVLITGGGKGIGRETARLFAQAGCNLVISGRDREALEATAHKLRTTSLPADGQTEQTGQTG